MAWPKQLIMVRHAESEGNLLSADDRAGLEVSTIKYNLTPKGIEQAKITGKYLHDIYKTFDVYYTSYYERSRQTMKIMYPGVKIYEDARLAEANRGIWHTMTKDQIAQKYPEEIIAKDRDGLYHHRPLGGESWADIELRIHSFLGTLSRDCGGKKVLMVVHGHWLMLFQRLITHFSTEEAIQRYLGKKIFANASITGYAGLEANREQRLLCVQENFVPWLDKLPKGMK